MTIKRKTVDNVPKLLKEWDFEKNEKHPSEYTFSSNEKVWWKCIACTRSWQAIVFNRVGYKGKKGTGCPMCQSMSERKRLDSLPHYLVEYSDLNIHDPADIRFSSTASLIWECSEKHIWKSSLNKRIKEDLSCTVCSGDFSPLYLSHPELFDQIVWDKTTLPQKTLHKNLILTTAKMKATWECIECDHQWEASVVNRTKTGTGCPQCHKRTHAEKQRSRSVQRNGSIMDYPELMQEWDFAKNANINPKTVPATWTKKVWWKCASGHSWQSKVRHRVSRDWQCPRCAALKSVNDYYKLRVAQEGSLVENRPELILEWDWDENTLNPYELLIGSHRKAYWVCQKCNHEWEAMIANRAIGNKTNCPECAIKSYVSRGEENLAEFIKTLVNNVKTSDRTVISPRELDIYLPDQRLAIEFNGDYWHSEAIIRERFGVSPYEHHLKKAELCKAVGITLLYVWESDWHTRRALMEDVLSTAVGQGVVHPLLCKLQ